MSILVVSVSHKTTSVGPWPSWRMDRPAAAKLADQLVASEHIDEAVVLSTCNRTELYASVSRFHGGLDDVTAALGRLRRARGRPSCAGDVRGLLRRGRGRPRLRGGRRPGLDGRRGEPDPRPGQSALTLCQTHGTVGTRAQRAVPAGDPGRQAGADRDRHRLGRPLAGHRRVRAARATECRHLAGAGCWWSGPARWPGSPPGPPPPPGAAAHLRQPDPGPRRAAGRGGRRDGRRAGRAAERAGPGRRRGHLHRGARHDARAGRRSPVRRWSASSTWRCPPTCRPRWPSSASRWSTSTGLVGGQLDARQPGRDRRGPRRWSAARSATSSACAAPPRSRPTVVALRIDGLRRGDRRAAPAGRPAARARRARQRARSSRPSAGSSTSCCTRPTVRVQELAADSEAVDYAAALRELFALDPQAVAAVMSPEVGR